MDLLENTANKQAFGTPRPWKHNLVVNTIYIDGEIITRVIGKEKKLPDGLDLQNAELIVRAVNSYDAVREALKASRKYILAYDEFNPRAQTALTMIEAALALVERGGKS